LEWERLHLLTTATEAAATVTEEVATATEAAATAMEAAATVTEAAATVTEAAATVTMAETISTAVTKGSHHNQIKEISEILRFKHQTMKEQAIMEKVTTITEVVIITPEAAIMEAVAI